MAGLRWIISMATIAMTMAMSTLAPGANVVVIGGGAIQSLASRIAALRGYKATVALPEQEMGTARALIFDDLHPEGSIPITLLPISGPDADSSTIEACVESADGLIICFDNEQAFMPESAMKIFTAGGNVKHIALMSRYLNGAGMGFFPNAAKVAANSEIWAATDALVAQFKMQDEMIKSRAKELGASFTIIRAGTLKGGASADAAISEGGGEAQFLNPFFYTLGQQDVVNWRLLYDCASLGVELSKGDTMPGPGFSAALTATSAEGGAGDSHRGAVATALVESLRVDAALGSDFSVASKPATAFPKPEQWASMFAGA